MCIPFGSMVPLLGLYMSKSIAHVCKYIYKDIDCHIIHNNLNKKWNLSILEMCKDFHKSEKKNVYVRQHQRVWIKCFHVCKKRKPNPQDKYIHRKRLNIMHVKFRDRTRRKKWV